MKEEGNNENCFCHRGAGFIGSHLVNRLSKNNHVVVLDNLSTGNIYNIESNHRVKFIEGDITDIRLVKQILNEYEFHFIYHLAAIASVTKSVAYPNETYKTNFMATVNLLEAAKSQQYLERFVFSSSAAVYGDIPLLPKIESSTVNPSTPYAIDKYASERYVLAFHDLYGINTTAVRFFNVYGPKQNPDSHYSGVISILTKNFQELFKNKESRFTIFGDGKQTRDFVYIDDVIDALLLVAKHPQAKGQIYNIGTSQPATLIELIQTYERITQLELPIQKKSPRRGDIKISYSDISKLCKLGFQTKFTLEQGLSEYWRSQEKL